MSKIKKIFIAIVLIILLVVIVQFVNAAKYTMVVNVVEGEDVMGINPLAERLDFGDLSRNNGMTRYVSLQNGGSTPVYIMVWKFGGIAELIELSRNNFTLNPGEEEKLAFTIKIPPSAEIKKYSGWTIVFRLPKFF